MTMDKGFLVSCNHRPKKRSKYTNSLYHTQLWSYSSLLLLCRYVLFIKPLTFRQVRAELCMHLFMCMCVLCVYVLCFLFLFFLWHFLDDLCQSNIYWQEIMLEFRAGKMAFEGKRVVPDTRKGLVRIARVWHKLA